MPFHVLAETRGIRAVSRQGQEILLYKDCKAVAIGVSDYDHWPKLPYAVRDATEVADKLRQMGFETTLVLDPTSEQLKKTLAGLAYEMGTEPDRALLLYFAGHGENETLADKTRMGYIVPRDCPTMKNDPWGFPRGPSACGRSSTRP